MTLAPGTRLGPFEIVGMLGAGGMGVVYRAHDPRLDRDVALKLLPAEYAADPERRARFEREARAAAALSHPNICTIHEIGEAAPSTGSGPPVLYIAMELLEGATLSECLATGPAPMGTGEVLDIGIQIAEALGAAEKRHLVHRDLKSANIVLLPEGQVKVLDFGLAKRVVEESEETRTAQAGLTDAGAVVGTVAYMSPEQALGHPVDHRSDLFSFGVVLYELLTGRLPFTGRTQTATIDAVLHQEPAPIPRFNEQAPDALVAVVKKLLEKDRERRYHSAPAVSADLRRIKDDLAAGRDAASSAPAQAAGPRSAWARRPVRLAAGAVVAVALAAAGLAAWTWWPGRASQSPIEPTRAASLVALPARVQGPAEAQYLADGIPNVLSSYLVGVTGLDTKVPPTSAQFDAVKGDVQTVAQAYRADLCLMSSVTARGEQLVLVLQLMDPRTRSAVWSRTFEGTEAGYLTLVKDAADGVRAALRPAAGPVVAPAGQTTNAGALQALQRGQYFSNRYNNRHLQADFDAAASALTEALRLDPALAQAAAEMAFLYIVQTEAGSPPAETMPAVRRWADASIAMDPRNALAWAALAATEAWDGLPGMMRRSLEKALRGATLAPRTARAQQPLTVLVPSVALSAAASMEVTRLDPLYVVGGSVHAWNLFYLERSREALPILEAARQIEPDAYIGLQASFILLGDLGRIADASRDLDRFKKLYPGAPTCGCELGVSLGRGDRRRADDVVADVLAQLRDGRTPSWSVRDTAVTTAIVLARHGRTGDALSVLEAGVDRGYAPYYDWLTQDTRLVPLRSHPRFQKILERSRAEFAEMLTVMDAARSRGEFPAYLEQPLKDIRAKIGM